MNLKLYALPVALKRKSVSILSKHTGKLGPEFSDRSRDLTHNLESGAVTREFLEPRILS